MTFLVHVPNGLIHWDHHDYTDPAQMARLLKSHIAHMGHITVEPVEEGTVIQPHGGPHGGRPKASAAPH